MKLFNIFKKKIIKNKETSIINIGTLLQIQVETILKMI